MRCIYYIVYTLQYTVYVYCRYIAVDMPTCVESNTFIRFFCCYCCCCCCSKRAYFYLFRLRFVCLCCIYCWLRKINPWLVCAPHLPVTRIILPERYGPAARVRTKCSLYKFMGAVGAHRCGADERNAGNI